MHEHRIWASMEALGPAIDASERLEDLDPDSTDGLERLRSILAFCGKRIGGTEPTVLLLANLESIAQAFDNQRVELAAFATDRNPQHIVNATGQAEVAISQLAYIPGLATSEESIAFIQALAAQRTTVHEMLRSASESRKKAIAEIESLDKFKEQSLTAISEIKGLLEAEKQRISALLTEQQRLFSEAQENRNATYTETVRRVQETVTKTLTDQQGQFSSAQENRNKEFTDEQREVRKQFNDLLTEHTRKLADQDAEFTKQRDTLAADAAQKLSDIHQNYLEKADNIMEHVNNRRKEIETLVGVIGNLGVTSGYQKTANQSRIAMWVWQGIAVFAMGGVIWFAYRAFLPAIQGDFKWGGFATRVFLTITVGVLAAYAARQADRFFEMEKYNRKLALELAAIDPFIALLPVEEQQKFKLEIGRRSFAQEEVASKIEKSPANALDVVLASKEGQQILQTILELAQKVPKVG